MIQVELQTLIDQPIDIVFDRLTDFTSYNEWMPDSSLLIESKQTSDDVGVGTTFSDKVKYGKVKGEVTLFIPPNEVAFRQTVWMMGIKLMESRPAYSLESKDSATFVRHRVKGNLFGVFTLFEPIVRKIVEKERERTVYALKTSFH